MKFTFIILFIFLGYIHQGECREGDYCGELLTAPLTVDEVPGIENGCRIFLVRHGETEWNVLGKPQGLEDIPLNETGRQQAAELAYNLSFLNISAVYGSALSRAVETALLVANHHIGCKVIIDPQLRFYDPNKKRDIPPEERELLDQIIDAEIISDAKAYLSQLGEEYKNQNVVIITHGKVIRLIIKAASERDLGKIKIQNTAVVRVIVVDGQLVLEK